MDWRSWSPFISLWINEQHHGFAIRSYYCGLTVLVTIDSSWGRKMGRRQQVEQPAGREARAYMQLQPTQPHSLAHTDARHACTHMHLRANARMQPRRRTQACRHIRPPRMHAHSCTDRRTLMLATHASSVNPCAPANQAGLTAVGLLTSKSAS